MRRAWLLGIAGILGRCWPRSTAALCTLLGAGVLLAAGARAAVAPAPGIAPAAAAERIVFSGDRNYPPFQFDGSAEGVAPEPDGFDVALFRAVARDAGLEVDYALAGWGESLELLQAGQVHVVPMFRTVERERLFRFSTAFLHRYHLVFGHRNSPYVASLEDLAGLRVAVQHAGLAWEELLRLGNVAIVPTAVEADAIAAVRSGQAEYALVPMTIGYRSIATDGRAEDIVALSPPLLEFPYAFAVAAGRDDLVARIDAGLERVQSSGERDRLYMQWLANLEPPRESFRSGLLAGGAVALPLLALTLLALLWLRRSRRHAAMHSVRAESEAVLRRSLEKRAEYLAFNDPVTGLPNRNGLERTLRQLLEDAAGERREHALIRLDLRDLQVLSAIGGEEIALKVRQAVARRLVAADSGRLVASVGAGEFAILLHGIDGGIDAAQQTMHALLELVHARIQIGDLPLEQRCCAGVALYPRHADTADTLLRAASMACTAAHERRSAAVVYDTSLEPDPRNLTLLAELREAIAQGTLGYAVQPKLDLRKRRIVGAEMLVRWQHPRHGALAPVEFVPLAEKAGVIGTMTLYLVRHAIALCRDWRLRGLELTLSVNVSVNDLADADLVSAIIAEAAAPACGLLLEVTESDLMRDGEEVLASVRRLRQAGVRISLDDFGTGYSSLTYLRRLAPDEVKIDRSFISELLRSPTDQNIVRTSIELAHSLGASVTAEGIEDAATLEWLAGLDCDAAQGYRIGRPMPVEQFLALNLDQVLATPAR